MLRIPLRPWYPCANPNATDASTEWTSLSFDEGESPRAVIGEMFAYHEATDLFVLHGGFTLDGYRFVNDT